MALLYCEVCGVLIAKPPGEAARRTDQGTICDKCFGSRKVIIAEGDSDNAEAPPPAPVPAAPDRHQFGCPFCRSLLQLKPVAKRSRIRCPRCAKEFYLEPTGGLTSLDGAPLAAATPPPAPAPAAPPAAAPAAPGPQSKLLDGLQPIKNLDFLDKVPEKQKNSVLPSVLDSNAYEAFDQKGSGSGSDVTTGRLDLAPQGAGPGTPAKKAPGWGSDSYRILDDSGSRPAAPKPTTRRITEPARRGNRPEKLDPEEEKRRAERNRKAREAEAATARYERAKSKKLLSYLGHVAVALAPLVIAAPFLASAKSGQGFASRDEGLGGALRDLGAVVRRGVVQWNALTVKSRSLDD